MGTVKIVYQGQPVKVNPWKTGFIKIKAGDVLEVDIKTAMDLVAAGAYEYEKIEEPTEADVQEEPKVETKPEKKINNKKYKRR